MLFFVRVICKPVTVSFTIRSKLEINCSVFKLDSCRSYKWFVIKPHHIIELEFQQTDVVDLSFHARLLNGDIRI